jgi:hypothetical protein
LGGFLALPAARKARSSRGSTGCTANQLAERRKELASQLLCGGVDQTTAKLREFTADLSINLVG